MEKKILFEYQLFRDETPDNIEEIDDIDFVINTLVNLSSFKPNKNDLIFMFHQKYSERKGFREKFLEKALNRNSLFVSLLVDKKIYSSDDVAHLYSTPNDTSSIVNLSNQLCTIECPRIESSDVCQDTFDLTEYLINTNYLPGTIEYCIRFDDIDGLCSIYQNPRVSQDPEFIIEIENIMNLNINLLGACGIFGSIRCFKYLLSTKEFLIDQSVIECVICGGSIEIFHLCLQTIGVSCIVSKLVILASCYNSLDFLVFLVENSAEISFKTENGETPLHYAALYGHLSVVHYLVKQKADINAQDKDGWTPLHFAARDGHLSVVEYLVNQKADVNEYDGNDCTPLHLASYNGHLSVVEYLVNQKADIKAKNKDDQTPLHFASYNGHLSIVKSLVNQKADINAKDKNVKFLFLMRLLFIFLLLRTILVLLNI